MIRHIFKLIWNKKGSNSLLILEIFLSFLVLFAVLSYVFFNTDKLSNPLGFETENRWLVLLDGNDGKDSIEIAETQKNLKIALSEMSEVNSVAYSNGVTPFGGSTWQSTNDDMGFEIFTRYVFADEDFGKTMGLKLAEGRWFNEDDHNATYMPMIVNQYFMDEYFPDKSMVDSILLFNGERKIVGVIEDYRYNGIFEEGKSTCFFFQPETHERVRAAYLHMNSGTPNSYEEEVSKVVEAVTKSTSFVIQDIDVLKKRNAKRTWIPIISLLSISLFLCLNVAMGLFGVLWYNINKRKHEIGLRRAMGAHSTNIAQQFTIEIMMLALLAIIVGTFFALQVPILKIIPLPSMIFYKAILFSAGIILFIVGLCALYPSMQASKIHPATALHED